MLKTSTLGKIATACALLLATVAIFKITYDAATTDAIRLPRHLWSCTMPAYPAGQSPSGTSRSLLDASCARYERAALISTSSPRIP